MKDLSDYVLEAQNPGHFDQQRFDEAKEIVNRIWRGDVSAIISGAACWMEVSQEAAWIRGEAWRLWEQDEQ